MPSGYGFGAYGEKKLHERLAIPGLTATDLTPTDSRETSGFIWTGISRYQPIGFGRNSGITTQPSKVISNPCKKVAVVSPPLINPKEFGCIPSGEWLSLFR